MQNSAHHEGIWVNKSTGSHILSWVPDGGQWQVSHPGQFTPIPIPTAQETESALEPVYVDLICFLLTV